MKLLFDENISHKLVHALADLYPDCAHPRDIGLKTSDDRLNLGTRKKQRFYDRLERFRLLLPKSAVQASTESDLDSARKLCHENHRVNLEKQLRRD